jgi:hypothetical protein
MNTRLQGGGRPNLRLHIFLVFLLEHGDRGGLDLGDSSMTKIGEVIPPGSDRPVLTNGCEVSS